MSQDSLPTAPAAGDATPPSELCVQAAMDCKIAFIGGRWPDVSHLAEVISKRFAGLEAETARLSALAESKVDRDFFNRVRDDHAEALHELSTLKADLAALREWQPIAEVPQQDMDTGERLILWSPDTHCYVTEGCFNILDGEWIDGQGDTMRPTMFQRLPLPPANPSENDR